MKIENSQAKIFSWLGPLIRDDPDILDVLPISCLGEILMNIFFLDHPEGSGYGPPLQKMILRLSYLSQSQSVTLTLEILEFFFKQMSGMSLISREKAKRIYCLLLATLTDGKYHADALNECICF